MSQPREPVATLGRVNRLRQPFVLVGLAQEESSMVIHGESELRTVIR